MHWSKSYPSLLRLWSTLHKMLKEKLQIRGHFWGKLSCASCFLTQLEFIWEPNYRLLLEWGRQLRAVGCKPAQGFLQPQDTSPTNLLPAKQAAASHINTHSLHKMTLTIQKCIYFYYLAVGFVFVEVITATLSFKLIYWYQTNSN